MVDVTIHGDRAILKIIYKMCNARAEANKSLGGILLVLPTTQTKITVTHCTRKEEGLIVVVAHIMVVHDT